MSVPVLPGVLTVSQAARHAGVSSWKIRGEIKAGRLKAAYIGSCIRILDEELGRYLRDCMASSSAGRAASHPSDATAQGPSTSLGHPAGGELDEAVA